MSGYAEIIVDLVSNAVDRPFHYRIPPALREDLKPGMKVQIPLGPRRCEGYILRLLESTDLEPSRLRDILAISMKETLLNNEQLALISWLSFRYYCRTIDALHAMIPASYRQGKRPRKKFFIRVKEGASAETLSRAPVQKEAFSCLVQKGPQTRENLDRLQIKWPTIRALEAKDLVEILPANDYGKLEKPEIIASSPLKLGFEQAVCYKQIVEALKSPIPQRFLLHGVTASGKTELYMQSIAYCLSLGRKALVLVPEIALTPQMIDHFEGRFPGRVVALHSRLTTAEKNCSWQRVIDDEVSVVLGARSAVFAPLSDLGLIVIDEEHETTYKQEETPRYHARDVAWWRTRYHKAVLVMGSATPSLESYYCATQGNGRLLTMSGRVTPTQLPPVTVIDMCRELKENHRQIFSRLLLAELQGVIERDEQALLFINRRGFAGFVLCRECGYVVRCPSCDVSLTLHLDRQMMCCHYCGLEAPVPHTCPECGGIKIRYFSAGTQRVEDEVKKLYPGLELIRMDSDTTTSRKAHGNFYRRFRDGKATVLIGTQMIAKGFDFPRVTLVGVVAADTTLNLPDFRAPERTFQLLTQVAGRTARGALGGKVIIQTYHPGHYAIQAAAKHDYCAFYNAEIENRRQLAYPPFSDLLRFLFSYNDEQKVFEAASWLTEKLRDIVGSAEILGPAPASLYRIKEQFRVQTIVKGKNLIALSPGIKKEIRSYHELKPAFPVRLTVDFNPLVVL
jgi:primosomal protein N' (replication factor Y) (superfamily II helicase)